MGKKVNNFSMELQYLKDLSININNYTEEDIINYFRKNGYYISPKTYNICAKVLIEKTLFLITNNIGKGRNLAIFTNIEMLKLLDLNSNHINDYSDQSLSNTLLIVADYCLSSIYKEDLTTLPHLLNKHYDFSLVYQSKN